MRNNSPTLDNTQPASPETLTPSLPSASKILQRDLNETKKKKKTSKDTHTKKNRNKRSKGTKNSHFHFLNFTFDNIQ